VTFCTLAVHAGIVFTNYLQTSDVKNGVMFAVSQLLVLFIIL